MTTDRINRRTFLKTSSAAVLTVAVSGGRSAEAAGGAIRLGGPLFAQHDSPESWVAALQAVGYRAAYCPLSPTADDATVNAYAAAAKRADITIAEVGAWSNPISPDEAQRNAALEKCRTHLALADRIGARCCVNIAGSRGAKWDGHDPKNFTQETFDMIVETTRGIIDAVKPTRTFFTLETMPWAYPDSADSYLALFKAIARKQFAVHLDPVNLICSPQRYYGNAEIVRECFRKLGPHIRSCHAKDIILRPELTTHLDEARPGLGGMDYAVFLKELTRLPDAPLMLEHLPNAEEYRLAAEHIRSVAKASNIPLA